MDRDSDESRVDRHGPFGVREPMGNPPLPVDEESAPSELRSGTTPDVTEDGTSEVIPEANAEEAPKPVEPTATTPEPASAPAEGSDGPGPGATSSDSTGTSRSDTELREKIIQAMKTVYDPEIPVNIYDLGMVYEIEVRPGRDVLVTMTLTSPACPVAGTLPGEVEDKVKEVDGVEKGKVELVWDPPWTPERMSESAKLELGMF